MTAVLTNGGARVKPKEAIGMTVVGWMMRWHIPITALICVLVFSTPAQAQHFELGNELHVATETSVFTDPFLATAVALAGPEEGYVSLREQGRRARCRKRRCGAVVGTTTRAAE